MPNIVTHYKFCKDRIEENDVSKIALLGSQGPDPFFYYVTSFKKNIKQHSKLGTKMHTMDPFIMYEYFIDYTLKRSDREKEILFSFIKGMMYHYCVDRRCHPYIFYIGGFKREGEKNSINYHLSHSAIETNIDVLLSQKYNIDVKPIDMVFSPIEQVKLVSVMIYSFVSNVINMEGITPSSYYDAVKGTYRLEKILYSKNGIKKKVFATLFRKTSLNTMSMGKDVKNNDKLDYLNEKKNIWKNPATGEEFNDNFFELLDKANRDGDVVDKIISLAISGEDYKKKLKEFTNKINHHGIKVGESKKYYSLIWNRLDK